MRLKCVSGIVPEEMAMLLWIGRGFDVDVYAKYSCTWINDYSVSILGYKIIENYLRLPLPKAPPLTVKPKSSRTVAPRFFNFSRVLFKRCEQNWWLRLLQYSDLKASWSLEIFESPQISVVGKCPLSVKSADWIKSQRISAFATKPRSRKVVLSVRL